MKHRYLSVRTIQRYLSNGDSEGIKFEPGVNLLIGPPNTGKTKWLQILDHLLGDPNSFDSSFEEHLVEKYDAASAEILIGDETILVERGWKEAGGKTKVFVNNNDMSARDFQHFLLEKLGIPLLHFPKGNPFSGQTWPELSFRMLLRHIYRQQRFWSGIADQQPEAEQHACLLQFLGLAEHLYTDEHGNLVELKLKVERLRARREQYGATLNELAGDVLTEPGLQLAVTDATVSQAEKMLTDELARFMMEREAILSNAKDAAVSLEIRGRVEDLSQRRATLMVEREESIRKSKATTERLDEMRRYHSDIAEELERLARAQDAGAVLSDLKITHCPACDQEVVPKIIDSSHCHLCSQTLPPDPLIEELGTARLRFENSRLKGELKEAEELLSVLGREAERISREQIAAEEQFTMIENELMPARQAVSAFVNEELSAIDMAMGELNERQRQVRRLKGALELGRQLTEQIDDLEKKIEPLQARVDEKVRATDFGRAEEKASDGINEYLAKINELKPQTWRHSSVNVNISRSSSTIKVGPRRWNSALGGTDTLYLFMAYHYGLLSLSNQPDCHYPGLSIIDLPGDFLGVSIEDKENFIVQPFIDLLKQKSFSGAQVIITGASFKGLEGAHRIDLYKPYVG